DVRLTAQHGRRKRVTRYREIEWLGAAVNVRTEVSIEVHVDVADWHLLGKSDIPSRRNLRVVKNVRESEPGHLRSCGQTSDEAGHPETHTTFIGKGTCGCGHNETSGEWASDNQLQASQ